MASVLTVCTKCGLGFRQVAGTMDGHTIPVSTEPICNDCEAKIAGSAPKVPLGGKR